MNRSLAPAIAGLLLLGSGAPRAQTLLVLNKAEGTVSLLDPDSGAIRATVEVGRGPHEAAVSPDGKTAVVCNYGQSRPGSTLSAIDVVAGKTTKTIDLVDPEPAAPAAEPRRFHRPHGIAFLDDRRVVVTAEAERRLLIVDVERGVVEAAIATRAETSHMVALAPGGKRAFVANIASGSVSVLDLDARAHVAVIETGAGAEGIAVHPTRPECWVTNRDADTVSVIDTEALAVVGEIACGSFPIRVQFTPDGAHALVSNAKSGAVAVIDVAARRIVREVAMGVDAVADAADATADAAAGAGRVFGGQFGDSPVPVGILVRPDGAVAWVANTQADIVTVIDLATWTVKGRLRAGREPDGMAWSPLE